MNLLKLQLRYQNNQYISLIEKILLGSLLILPLALISGPFLSDLLIIVSACIFIFFTIREKNFKFYRNFFIFFFLLFYINLILSSFLSDNILLSFESSLFYFRFIFFALAIWYVHENYNSFNIYFFYVLLFSGLFLSLDGLFQFYYGSNILGFNFDNHRLSGLFGSEAKLGSYLSRLMPILFSLYFYNLKNLNFKIKILFCFYIILASYIVLITGERVSNFYIILIALFIFIISIRNLKFFIIVFILLNTFVFIFMVNEKAFNHFMYRNIISTIEQSNALRTTQPYNLDTKKKLSEHLFKGQSIKQNLPIVIHYLREFSDSILNTNIKNIFNNNENEGKEIYFISYPYHTIYSTALSIIKKNFPYGIGPKMFRIECAKIEHYKDFNAWEHKRGCSTHPHNTYLQLLLETGFFGFIFVFVVFLLVFTKIIHYLLIYFLTNNIFIVSKLFLYIALLISLFPFQPTGSFFNNWNSIIYFLPVGFILKEIYSKKT